MDTSIQQHESETKDEQKQHQSITEIKPPSRKISEEDFKYPSPTNVQKHIEEKLVMTPYNPFDEKPK